MNAGNTIRNASVGVLLGGGRRNSIHDNHFVDNDFDIHFDNRGETWQASASTSTSGRKILWKGLLS